MKTKLVIAHMNLVALENVEFKVSEAGRQRVLREKRKNVHAGVIGYICETTLDSSQVRILYDPYKAGDFLNEGAPIKVAKKVLFSTSGLFLLEA